MSSQLDGNGRIRVSLFISVSFIYWFKERIFDMYILAFSSKIYQLYVFKFKSVSYKTSKIYQVCEYRKISSSFCISCLLKTHEESILFDFSDFVFDIVHFCHIAVYCIHLAAITRCKCAWGKFRQLLPLLTNRHLPLLTRGKVYSSCVRSVMLHAAETWAMKVDTLNRLQRNDRAMIRWICNVRAKEEVSSDSLLTKLDIQDLDVVLRTSRMRWFGHVERSTGWIAEVRKLNVVAQKRSGRPRKSWDEVLENDRKKLGMDSADPQNCSEWRGRLRERLVKKPNPR